MTETTHKLAIIPDQLLFSARHAITQAAGCQVTAEANAIIQATLDYLTAQPAVPAMLMTSAMRAELVDDTAATFCANGPETHQVVRDVIEYVDSWLQVQLGRAQDAAQATQAAPDALQAATAARIQAQMEVANLKERLARARINLMTELREKSPGTQIGALIEEFAAKSLSAFEKKGYAKIRLPSGQTGTFFPAGIVGDVALGVIDAALLGHLHPKRKRLIPNCRKILSALATTGEVALIDEATGYQHHRAPDALQERWRPDLYQRVITYQPPKAATVAAPEAVPLTDAWAAPSTEAAHAIGANGGPVVEEERLAFEAWMRGHCWALCATWNGKEYRSDAEQGGAVDPRAIQTRQLWAAWRDRAALANGGRWGVKLEGGGA